MGISAGINLLVSQILLKTAHKTGSPALEADALHLRTDVYTSLGVFGGMILIYFTHLSFLDPLIALLIGNRCVFPCSREFEPNSILFRVSKLFF